MKIIRRMVLALMALGTLGRSLSAEALPHCPASIGAGPVVGAGDSRLASFPVSMFTLDLQAFEYGPFSRVLFLSAGNGFAAELLRRQAIPGQLVVATDLANGPHVDVRATNACLPFADRSFDLMVMNRGLCVCDNPPQRLSCGGVPTTQTGVRSYLASVISILRPGENSLAIFTGFAFIGPAGANVLRAWPQALEELQRERPGLQVAVLKDEHEQGSRRSTVRIAKGFVGFAVSASPSRSIEDQLKALFGTN